MIAAKSSAFLLAAFPADPHGPIPLAGLWPSVLIVSPERQCSPHYLVAVSALSAGVTVQEPARTKRSLRTPVEGRSCLPVNRTTKDSNWHELAVLICESPTIC
ncbi:unnamed protein product [Nippostrongylus brasiliensis]|uniref:Secreted protein n=1 Tax=Nippostrongylus brasiliensis TaxID=27835 RepID=A0A0N4Y6F6_NIPBR|nr:unnamed protein product [Nippostrongylus brasiliensis]